MKRGLVFGKFMPFHTGHQALINFGLQHCDFLYVVVCHCQDESINGDMRCRWLTDEFKNISSIQVLSFEYDSNELENSSASSREISKKWALAFKQLVPDVEIVFTSEPYGEYLAEYLSIEHRVFDEARQFVTVSATMIREQPFKYWSYITASARMYFIKKIVLVGTESTGKTTLTERLGRYYETSYVTEGARDIIERTEECTFDDLQKIAEHHARSILEKLKLANKLLFVDTDLIITKSYSRFLFNRELNVENWVEAVNKFDLYLYLEPDCEYVQDGTRLSESERNLLSIHHKKGFTQEGISFISIDGNWEERFQKAVAIIDQLYFK